MMMMKLLRLPLVVALALCWLGAGVQALKSVPSKTAVKAVQPPARTDITHKLNTIDMMIAVRASQEGGREGWEETRTHPCTLHIHRVALPRPWATWPCTLSTPSRRSNKRRPR